MKVKELSVRANVPIPTIKYYLREGLLPKGEPLGETKAEYDERHLDRLRLIRTLVEVGEVPIAGIRELLAAADDETVSARDLLSTAMQALAPGGRAERDGTEQALDRTGAAALVTRQGWRPAPGSGAQDQLARVLASLRRFGLPADGDHLTPYLDAASRLAGHESLTDGPAGREELAVRAIVATVLYDRLLLALVRLAKEDTLAREPGEPDTSP